jgi:tetratricopeptide (TPR) repeat protein
MKTIDFSYFIERYNADEMSGAEKLWFQKELENNEKLRYEVELRKGTDEVLRNQNVVLLRNKLAEIEKRRKENVPVKKSTKHNYIKYAALIIGLILIGSIAFITSRNLNGNRIIDKYYTAYEPAATPRSMQTETIDDFYTTGVDFYNIHDYENAAIQFSKVLQNDPLYMQSVLLLGVSRYENKQYTEAEHSLNKVIVDRNNYFIEEAQWYLAWCYIKTDQKGKAIQQLEIIKNDKGNIYMDRAKKIIRGLK